MKKFLLFAAACVALVACNQKDNAFNTAPETTPFAKGQKVTLTVNNGSTNSQSPIRKVKGIDTGSDMAFQWEENDSVLITVAGNPTIFHIIKNSISSDGKSAEFEGWMPEAGYEYSIQYPVQTPDLTLQHYSATEAIPSEKMLFMDTNCSLDKPAQLKAQYAILQLNISDEKITTDTVQVQMWNSQESYNLADDPKYTYNLAIKDPVELSNVVSFFLVVEPGTYYFQVIWHRYGMNEWAPTQTIETTKTFTAGECLNMEECCLAAGTRITMADGSIKLIEDIQLGDLVRTFDHETGAISSSKICLAWKGETKERSLDLTFASGKTLAIVGTHDLLLENTRKYVRVNSGNVANYVGKRFYNAETGAWDELVSYDMSKNLVDYYCIYSAKHLNCIAEGLITCPDDVDFLLNIYEMDANLKADATQLASDIAQYGLFDIAQYDPSYAQYKEQFEELGGKYIYVARGKGLVTREELLALLDSNWD